MQLNRNALLPSKMDISDYAILKIVFVIVENRNFCKIETFRYYFTALS